MNVPSKSVIISGPPAVGKTTLARAVSKAFGLRQYGGGDSLKDMAIKLGFKPSGDDWWDTSEGIKFLEKRSMDHSFDRKVDDQLLKVASGGGVVITSYTLPWIYENGVKIWLKATLDERIRRMAARDDLSLDQALRATQRRDAENRELYKRLYNFDFGDDLSVFDFVLVTDLLPPEDVQKLVLTMLGRLL